MPVTDVFVNQAYLSLTESAANTLTFSKLETGISIHEKVGWLISRIDYSTGIDSSNFGASGDSVAFGMSTSDAIAAATLAESAVIDYNSIVRLDWGTAASGGTLRQPFQKDFSNLPGGGILVPPNPLYLWCKGTALTSAMVLVARMFYTVRQLKTEDFWELVELRRMIGT
jgi:hypothetical protein